MIAPSDLQLGTYTNKKLKILGSWSLYIIHPDTKCISEITFLWLAMKAISWFHAQLVLIKPDDRLDHLPPEHNVISQQCWQVKRWVLIESTYISLEAQTEKQAKIKLLLCVQFRNNLLQVHTKNNILMGVPRKNNLLPSFQRRNKTRTVKLIKVHTFG